MDTYCTNDKFGFEKIIVYFVISITKKRHFKDQWENEENTAWKK